MTAKLSYENCCRVDSQTYLWFWQERYATQDAPWWGKTYAIALEPWTTKHFSDPQDSIEKGEYLHIPGSISIQSSMEASVINRI